MIGVAHAPDVFEVEELLPLADGVVLVDQLRLDDGDAYLANGPLAVDLFWPVAMDPGAIEDWIRGSTSARAPSLLLAVRANGVLVAGVEARTLTLAIGELLYWVFPAYRGCGMRREPWLLFAMRSGSPATSKQFRCASVQGTPPPWPSRSDLASWRSSVTATRFCSTTKALPPQPWRELLGSGPGSLLPT